jgi:hypothetical protein
MPAELPYERRTSGGKQSAQHPAVWAYGSRSVEHLGGFAGEVASEGV